MGLLVRRSRALTCTITAANGYRLATFTDNTIDKKTSLTADSYTITNVTASHTITATFSLIPATPVTTTKAKIYLGLDDSFTVSNTGTTVYGGSGIDMVTISEGVSWVTLDQNVERINLSGASSKYAFKQTGNKINVYDSTGATLLANLPVQGDTDGTVLGFSDGIASAKLVAGVMTLGGAAVSTTAPTTLAPTLQK